MNKLFPILFLFTALLSNACAKDGRQLSSSKTDAAASNQIKNGESLELVGEKKNAKHDLTALFYRSTNEPSVYSDDNLFYNRLIIRRDKTNKESKPIEVRPGYKTTFQDVWSPNEDFLLLPGSVCGQDGFCIYESLNIVGDFERNAGFQVSLPTDFLNVFFTEFRPKSESGKIKPCQHFFEKWTGEASLVFAVKAYESKDGSNKFKYDLTHRALFGGIEFGNDGFAAINKNGKLNFAGE